MQSQHIFSASRVLYIALIPHEIKVLNCALYLTLPLNYLELKMTDAPWLELLKFASSSIIDHFH